ncbi:MAG: helix-turn-helix domain-containing protein [Sphingomonas sp.]|uniref:helix-turn-helix domain-containing protein n=1 Tax=Sphingomonas sp. TaxID=28214 RepID=UPI00341C527C|nr:helix-turn-helix domain-containing protein [Sphingomonas sp.]
MDLVGQCRRLDRSATRIRRAHQGGYRRQSRSRAGEQAATAHRPRHPQRHQRRPDREAAGLSHRQLQRWFAAHIGLPPRSYLRLLRFRDAIGAIHGKDSPADAAAAQGYADQAHMARDFRALAGVPPSGARRRARGPFI